MPLLRNAERFTFELSPPSVSVAGVVSRAAGPGVVWPGVWPGGRGRGGGRPRRRAGGRGPGGGVVALAAADAVAAVGRRGVGAPAAVDGVGPLVARRQRVAAGAARQEVGPAAAVDRVVARPAA